MKRFILSIVLLLAIMLVVRAENSQGFQSIHVIVALCDNKHQGIVPVPELLGNGENPTDNLYWGAKFGLKTYFKNSREWQLLSTVPDQKPDVLERCVFVHRERRIFLVADAYRGQAIQQAIVRFLKFSAGQSSDEIPLKFKSENLHLKLGGDSDLLAYVGHNGLMDFELEDLPRQADQKMRQVIILACRSKAYFEEALRTAGAFPLLWTTGFLAPEAYTLKSVIDGWVLGENNQQIILRAADSYNQFHKCRLEAAKKLFGTGYN
jgi:hypothetical protein